MVGKRQVVPDLVTIVVNERSTALLHLAHHQLRKTARLSEVPVRVIIAMSATTTQGNDPWVMA